MVARFVVGPHRGRIAEHLEKEARFELAAILLELASKSAGTRLHRSGSARGCLRGATVLLRPAAKPCGHGAASLTAASLIEPASRAPPCTPCSTSLPHASPVISRRRPPSSLLRFSPNSHRSRWARGPSRRLGTRPHPRCGGSPRTCLEVVWPRGRFLRGREPHRARIEGAALYSVRGLVASCRAVDVRAHLPSNIARAPSGTARDSSMLPRAIIDAAFEQGRRHVDEAALREQVGNRLAPRNPSAQAVRDQARGPTRC